MPTDSVSTARLDYLQRVGLSLGPLPSDMPKTTCPPTLRRLWRITGVGCLEKAPAISPGQPMLWLSPDLLIALSGYNIPLAWWISGEPRGVAIHLGTWSPLERENASGVVLDARQEVVRTVLQSLYPAVDLVPADGSPPRLPLAGVVLGIPTAKPPDTLDGALPLDRVIRAMAGEHWACLVLAQPVLEQVTRDLRHQLINEMRAIQSAAEAAGAPSPLAQHYTELLDLTLITLTQAQAVGAWRTGVYLLGDEGSYYRLASLWRGLFSGEGSLPEPVRVWDIAHADDLAAAWALPDLPGPAAPEGCHFRHPFEYQTLLTSSQLAAYVHVPRFETPGFTVSALPDFDAVPPSGQEDCTVQIGRVLHRSRATQTLYKVSPHALTRHAFVAGVTGSGKSNTIFHVLKQVATANVPFLVIEPAKREYRAFLNEPNTAPRLRVFTLGDETVAPFRLNPFEVVAWPKTPVAVHLDLLRSVFAASFGMWTPLPQVLEQCLHGIYEDRGWDLITNANRRLDGGADVAAAFPTLSDLLVKVDDVTERLGYERKITDDLRAALRTRINALRAGGKGRMLDVQQSLPMEALLEHPTVLELEGMGDDDDKAFLIGLLLIRLAEYRRAGGEAGTLRHLLVIEEAHRLLANVGERSREEEAAPRSKAVETFANLLSEIRAYGQGVIVADQVPVKLAPEVIKNTNLKIAHRVVAADDRMVLAGAMAMSERQAHALATLRPLQAAVFADGDDAPILVEVPWSRSQSIPADEQIKQAWRVFREAGHLAPMFDAYVSCTSSCPAAHRRQCGGARKVAEAPAVEEAFAAFLLSLASEDLLPTDGDFPQRVDDLKEAVLRATHPLISDAENEAASLQCILTHALYRYLDRRGAQYGWSYREGARLAELLLPTMAALAADQPVEGRAVKGLVAFGQAYRERCQRGFAPFHGCARACGDPPTCLYRFSVEPLMGHPQLDKDYQQSAWATDDLIPLGHRWANRIVLLDRASAAHRRAALCLLIQKVHADQGLSALARENLVDEVIEAYDARTP